MATFVPPYHCRYSLRDARDFIRGFCVERVIARLPRVKRFAFVIVHPKTAERRGWKVVS